MLLTLHGLDEAMMSCQYQPKKARNRDPRTCAADVEATTGATPRKRFPSAR